MVLNFIYSKYLTAFKRQGQTILSKDEYSIHSATTASYKIRPYTNILAIYYLLSLFARTPKIYNLYRTSFGIAQKNIFWFEVTMNNVHRR